ncbi:hypothetical protein G7Z17_g12865 [Cylindrodendrum hubeiense]|uniref:Uncharacterized protein n=1 Tax=Cylindrodendrum hubeiense TaxID=595255 RepID=A0A9P5L2R1_9HYPO|nr:hypothetical protein G7Z17_g12865 [Cylindrodendrum hubeiense]
MATRTPYLDSYTERRSFVRGASRANEAGVRAKDHLKKALSEIDGLFAGLSYLDKTESLTHDAFSTPFPGEGPREANYMDLDLDLELDVLSTQESPPEGAVQQDQNNHPPDPTPESRRRDWSSIRGVRDGVEILWKDFDDLATKLDNDAINNIRKSYGDAKGLRETGVVAFRNTLTGPAPNDLKKIFAFASLSYVVSCLLRDRNRLSDEDVLDGIQVWMNAIQDQDERDAFATLARQLWPEAKNYIHAIPLGISARQRAAAFHGHPWANASNDVPVSGVDHFLDQTLDGHAASSVPSVDTYQPPVIPFADSESIQLDDVYDPGLDYVCTLTGRTFTEFEWSRFLDLNEIPDTDRGPSALPVTGEEVPTGLPPEPQFFQDPGPTGQAEAKGMTGDDPPEGLLKCLQNTQLFVVFSIFFKELNQLLYVLSGQRTTARDISSPPTMMQEQYTRDRINEDYFWPLVAADGSKDAPSQGILSVASKFVSLGYLQTVEEVMAYMIIVGREIFDVDAAAYQRYMEWICTPLRSTISPSPPASSVLKPKRPSGGVVKKKAAKARSADTA